MLPNRRISKTGRPSNINDHLNHISGCVGVLPNSPQPHGVRNNEICITLQISCLFNLIGSLLNTEQFFATPLPLNFANCCFQRKLQTISHRVARSSLEGLGLTSEQAGAAVAALSLLGSAAIVGVFVERFAGDGLPLPTEYDLEKVSCSTTSGCMGKTIYGV